MKITFWHRLILLLFIATVAGCVKNNKYENDIGYIDPSTALGDKAFETCYSTIYQYYNSNPDAGYKYGKKALRDSVTRKYSRISNDSGYLTFRFIINCNGIAGRYEIVENDLDLKPKKFNKLLKAQLFKITSELKEWNPVILNSKPKDSYIYITYKLKDGYITEILP